MSITGKDPKRQFAVTYSWNIPRGVGKPAFSWENVEKSRLANRQQREKSRENHMLTTQRQFEMTTRIASGALSGHDFLKRITGTAVYPAVPELRSRQSRPREMKWRDPVELFVIVALAWTNGAWLTAFGVCWNARRRLERKLAERETECRHTVPPVSFRR